MSMELLSGELDDLTKVRDLFVIIRARFGVYRIHPFSSHRYHDIIIHRVISSLLVQPCMK